LSRVLILNESEVRGLLKPAELFDALESALRELSAGRTSVPPRVAAVTPNGLLAAMPGHVPGAGLVVKLVSVYPGNSTRGLPSHQAVIGLFDSEDGHLLALMDGTSITAIRTATAAAVAAKALARTDSEVLAILGAGVQGAAHLDAFANVFYFREVRVSSRDRQHAQAVASRHSGGTTFDSFEEAVRGADVVCCCTDAHEPVVRREWVSDGAHVGSVGSGRELDEATLSEGKLFVEWRGAVTNAPPAGAVELQGRDPAGVTEIGEVLSGERPGRRSAGELTVYKSTGHAAEDAAAAGLVYRRAKESGVGSVLDL
jgi:ornithine cyclodeaminase/alanine dehydrogenase-like protein (mu-crystallin family)